MPLINPTSDVTFLGTTLILGEDTKFPPYPRNGEFSFLGGILHVYGTVDNITTWFPITAQNQYYIHIQEEEDNIWTLVHNLDNPNLIVMAYNQEGLLVEAGITYLNNNETQLHFSMGYTGKAIIFVPKDIGLLDFENQLVDKANTSDVYTRLEVDTKDALKANGAQVYFQSVLDTMIGNKADIGNLTVTLTGDTSGTGFVSNDGSGTLTLDTVVDPTKHSHNGSISDSGHSFAANGYQKFSNGLIIQWAYVNYTTQDQVCYFPIAFPHACLSLGFADYISTGGYASGGSHYHSAMGASYFKLGGLTTSIDLHYIAIGY